MYTIEDRVVKDSSESITGQEHRNTAQLPTNNNLQELYGLLGDRTVLIPVERGTKRPMKKGWPETTFEKTQVPEYMRSLERNNIGVLVGPVSDNLVDVDCDDDEFMKKFIKANTDICFRTLISKGNRGCHFWFRIRDEYPTDVVHIKDQKGDAVGEFRGGNGNSIIAGIHPSGGKYVHGDKPPLEIQFKDINWPEGYGYSWDIPVGGGIPVGGRPATKFQDRIKSASGQSTGGGYGESVIAGLRLRLPEYLDAIGVKLKPEGGRFVGLCPGHDDHKPSFSVFGDDHQMCGCFPCEYKGDVFATSQWLGRSTTFPEAVREVAGVLEVDLPDIGGASFRSLPVSIGPETETDESDSASEDEPPDTPFPLHCLPGAAGDMAREIARVTTSQNVPLAATSVIGILSASLGAGLEVGCGGERRNRGNLYILAIAESGTGKGEAFSLAAAPYEVAESQAIEAFETKEKPGLLASLAFAEREMKELEKVASREEDMMKKQKALEGYKKVAGDIAKLQRQIDSEPRMKVEDITKEALAVRMSGQSGESLASLSSEARGVFSILKGKYSKEGGDEDFYCKAYSGESVSVDRIGRPKVNLRKPCLSIVWMIQPDAARDAFGTNALTESGLLPRFLMFNPKAEPLERLAPPTPIPTEVKTGWGNHVISLVDRYRMRGDAPETVEIAEGVGQVMLDFENENIRLRRREGKLHDSAPYVARWSENAWRMALVLHAAKHGDRAHTEALDVITACNAIEVMRWFIEKQLEVLAAGRYEKNRSRLSVVLAVLADAGGEISLRDLRRSHSFERPEIDQLQAKFPSRLRVVKRKSGSGRPSEVLMTLPEDLKK